VSKASVSVANQVIADMGAGLVVLLGVGEGDGEADAEYMAAKVAGLRVFDDAEGRLNLSLADTGGSVLLVSQFTLYGDCRKGRRPSFTGAAPPQEAERLYELVAEKLRSRGLKVQTGRFQEEMMVCLVNHGPVTLLLDSGKAF
jgi:D-tyrosyl-tRNA(Tyr) deacylase